MLGWWICTVVSGIQVLRDLQLREFRESERVSGYDQELLTQYQTDFFSMKKPEKRQLGGKRKRTNIEKCPWAVTGQRNSAMIHINAIDHQLFLTIGAGLIAFAGLPADQQAVALSFIYNNVIPPVMTLCLDEGSPAYSMCWYLLGHEDLRMIPIRDPYHREWNDLRLAISAAGLWHVVLMMTIVYNMPFGPWDSGSWFEKITSMAEEMVLSLGPSNPLWKTLYESVCKDLGLEPEGTPQHMRIVLHMALQ